MSENDKVKLKRICTLMNSIDLINRLETSRVCKDIKYIVYRIVWKWRYLKLFKELRNRLIWNDRRCRWEDSDLCPVFNWRLNRYNFDDHDQLIYSFVKGNVPVINPITERAIKLSKNH